MSTTHDLAAYDRFLLAYFLDEHDEHGEQVRFAVSDGPAPVSWTALNAGEPVLRSDVGEYVRPRLLPAAGPPHGSVRPAGDGPAGVAHPRLGPGGTARQPGHPRSGPHPTWCPGPPPTWCGSPLPRRATPGPPRRSGPRSGGAGCSSGPPPSSPGRTGRRGRTSGSWPRRPRTSSPSDRPRSTPTWAMT
ncbi:hypothetical protein ACRAWF_22380 [Streptomyces sp. L7]